MKQARPSPNAKDACCRCGKILPTPLDVEKPAAGELRILDPLDPKGPAQWICKPCDDELTAETASQLERRSS